MAKFDANKEVTNRLTFKPEPTLNNLCLGKLVNVEVRSTETKTENKDGNTSTWEYAGQTIPRLVFCFESVTKSKDEPVRYFDYIESVIGTKNKDGEDTDKVRVSALYENMWNRILHIHKAFEKLPNYKAMDKVPSIDEFAPIEKRLKEITTFFNYVAKSFNEGLNKKAIYKNSKDESVSLYMKLVADFSTGRFLTFPTFVGQGFIEVVRMNGANTVPATIELKPNESIQLKGKGAKIPQTLSDTPSVEMDSEVERLLKENQR